MLMAGRRMTRFLRTHFCRRAVLQGNWWSKLICDLTPVTFTVFCTKTWGRLLYLAWLKWGITISRRMHSSTASVTAFTLLWFEQHRQSLPLLLWNRPRRMPHCAPPLSCKGKGCLLLLSRGQLLG